MRYPEALLILSYIALNLRLGLTMPLCSHPSTEKSFGANKGSVSIVHKKNTHTHTQYVIRVVCPLAMNGFRDG